MPSATNPAIIIRLTPISGNFGKFLIINLRCGCNNTNNTQKTAKYIIYGVNIAKSNMIAKRKLYSGFGRFSPWIFDPSHSSNVGQNTSIISGVPEPAKKRKGVDKIIKQDARSDTLLLNQRLSNRINSKPSNNPIRILGNFTV